MATSFCERMLPKLFFVYWNRLLLRLSNAIVGRNCMMYNRVYITHGGDFEMFRIGDNFLLLSGDGYNPLSRGGRAHVHLAHGARLSIGNNVGMSSPCIWCEMCISIGDNVKVGANCTILDTDCHSLDYYDRRIEESFSRETHNKAKCAPIYIQNDVMIGCNVTILKGVTIGERAIIGACSVVTKDVPAGCIVAGNPARIVGRIQVH